MEVLANLHLIVLRALEISAAIISPVSVLFYAVLVGLVVLTYHKRPRVGSFVHIMAMIFLFFVIWNHPEFSWYKRNPWNGGYVYAAVIIVLYMYLPLKAVSLGLRFYRRWRAKQQ